MLPISSKGSSEAVRYKIASHVQLGVKLGIQMETSSDPPYGKVSGGKGMFLLKQSKLKQTGHERLSSSRCPFWVWMGTGGGKAKECSMCMPRD